MATNLTIQYRGGAITLDMEKIERKLHVTDNDRVILSGTLIEGIGNRQSDLDIYVLTDKIHTFGDLGVFGHSMCHNKKMMHCTKNDEVVRRTLDYYGDYPMHVEVEYWTYQELEELFRKVEDRFTYVSSQADVTSYSPFIVAEENLFHRLIVGTELGNARPLGDTIINAQLQEKYCFIAYRETAGFFWKFKDIIGCYEAKDFSGAAELGREFLIDQTRGLLSLLGMTNKKKRWMTSYFKIFEEHGHHRLGGELMSLMFRDISTEPLQRQYVQDLLSAFDRINILIRNRLDASHVHPSTNETLLQLNRERATRLDRLNTCDPPFLFSHEFSYRENMLGGNKLSHFELFEFCNQSVK